MFNFYSWAKGKFEFQVEGPLRGLVVKFKKCNRREEAGEVFQAGQIHERYLIKSAPRSSLNFQVNGAIFIRVVIYLTKLSE